MKEQLIQFTGSLERIFHLKDKNDYIRGDNSSEHEKIFTSNIPYL